MKIKSMELGARSWELGILRIAAAALLIGCNVTLLAGPEPIVETNKAVVETPAASLYRAGEFDISAFGAGEFTKSDVSIDRYFSVRNSFGGGIGGKYFFTNSLGLGFGIDGYDVKNVSTPARVATSQDARRFVGDALISATFRYPIGAIAPYVRVGGGTIFNGGNHTLTEPTGTIGKKLKFEIAEHDAKILGEGAVGVEYRFSPNIGIFAEGAFDKIDRPHSNFFTTRVGMVYAF